MNKPSQKEKIEFRAESVSETVILNLSEQFIVSFL